MSDATTKLNVAQSALRATAKVWADTKDPKRKAEAFQALCEAAARFTAARDAFRDWVRAIPSPKTPAL